MKVVLFHRNFRRFQGGHLKVFHYFEHVRSSPFHQARIRFSPDSIWDASNPWSQLPEAVIGPDDEVNAKVLFLAGMDWQLLAPERRAGSEVPIINLIQGFSDTRSTAPLHQFISHRAIRICVSVEIQQALEATRAIEGPIFTVPIGLDLERLPPARSAEERDIDCIVLAVKDPALGRSIAQRLRAERQRVLLVDRPLHRGELLKAIARARVTVHLPASREGAYLPALESMALGALVICPDCVGNRSFCRDGVTCLMPRRSRRALVRSALEALKESPGALVPMLSAAREQSAAHSLDREQAGFLEILEGADELWTAR